MNVARFLHVVGLTFFVGGQLMLVAVIVPAVHRTGITEDKMRVLARRFGVGSAIALAVVIGSGVYLASETARWDDSVLQIKLMLLVLVAVLVGLHIASPTSRALSGLLVVASLAIVWLGLDLAHF